MSLADATAEKELFLAHLDHVSSNSDDVVPAFLFAACTEADKKLKELIGTAVFGRESNNSRASPLWVIVFLFRLIITRPNEMRHVEQNFYDIGAGVGGVIVAIAAAAASINLGVRCFGLEIKSEFEGACEDLIARLSCQKMKSKMANRCLRGTLEKVQRTTLWIKGDVMKCAEALVSDVIEAKSFLAQRETPLPSIIYAANVFFPPNIQEQIRNIFLKLPEGTIMVLMYDIFGLFSRKTEIFNNKEENEYFPFIKKAFVVCSPDAVLLSELKEKLGERNEYELTKIFYYERSAVQWPNRFTLYSPPEKNAGAKRSRVM
jgi:hypothetical protein